MISCSKRFLLVVSAFQLLAQIGVVGSLRATDSTNGQQPDPLMTQVQSIIAKSKALGIRDYPVGFWNYAALANASEPAVHQALIEPVAYADNNTASAFAAAMAPCDALTR